MGLAPVHQLEMGDRRFVMCAGRYMLFFRWSVKAIPFRQEEMPTSGRPARRAFALTARVVLLTWGWMTGFPEVSVHRYRSLHRRSANAFGPEGIAAHDAGREAAVGLTDRGRI
jgi:hypothetical protein